MDIQWLSMKKTMIISGAAFLVAILLFYVLDHVGIGHIIAMRFFPADQQENVVHIISGVKNAVIGLCSFFIGQTSGIIEIYKEIRQEKKEETPDLYFAVLSVSIPRMSRPGSVDEVLVLGAAAQGQRKRFIQCSVKNLGRSDILRILINGERLRCPILESGESALFCIQTVADGRELQLEIRCQNHHNVLYKAAYSLSIDIRKTDAEIHMKEGFAKVKANV